MGSLKLILNYALLKLNEKAFGGSLLVNPKTLEHEPSLTIRHKPHQSNSVSVLKVSGLVVTHATCRGNAPRKCTFVPRDPLPPPWVVPEWLQSPGAVRPPD